MPLLLSAAPLIRFLAPYALDIAMQALGDLNLSELFGEAGPIEPAEEEEE
jgi:hypothetical protein